MNLHYNTVSPLLLDCLQKLMANDAFKDFVLVGGTGLSLQLGHRKSVDIDLFTALSYGDMNLREIRDALKSIFPYTDNLDAINTRELGYTVQVGYSAEANVKLDLFYTDKFIEPIVECDGLRIASLQDIAAMKMQAITTGKRKKDFWDIHELLEHFSLNELIEFGLRRNPFTLTEELILSSLNRLTDLTQDSVIHCLKGKYWEFICEDIQDEVRNYKSCHHIL
jgi:predicted nucleotidyltransferase component of viral defense system